MMLMTRYSVNVTVLCQAFMCLFRTCIKAFLVNCLQSLTFCAVAPIITHSVVELFVLPCAGCKENQFSSALFLPWPLSSLQL